jgi:hypothetical protein
LRQLLYITSGLTPVRLMGSRHRMRCIPQFRPDGSRRSAIMDRSLELVRLADVPGPDPFSEGQLLGLELATKLRALALRVSDRRDARRRCAARCCMFAIDPPHRIASAPGHMKHAMNTSNTTDRSPRIADFQSAPSEAPRPMQKIAFETQKRPLRSLKNVLTSAQRLVQSRHPNRAPSKII